MVGICIISYVIISQNFPWWTFGDYCSQNLQQQRIEISTSSQYISFIQFGIHLWCFSIPILLSQKTDSKYLQWKMFCTFSTFPAVTSTSSISYFLCFLHYSVSTPINVMFLFVFLPEWMLEKVIEVESCWFDNCNSTVIEKRHCKWHCTSIMRHMGEIQKYYSYY